MLVRYSVHTPVRTPMYGLPLSQSDQRIRSVFQSVSRSVYSNTLYCRNTRILGWTKTFSDWQPSTSLPDCLTMLPLFVFMWWEDFQKISRKCVGWEVEGFSFRLNGWQHYYTRNYEKKCEYKAKKKNIQKTFENLEQIRGYLNKTLPIGKVKTYLEATEMLKGILKVQYQKVPITKTLERFESEKVLKGLSCCKNWMALQSYWKYPVGLDC